MPWRVWRLKRGEPQRSKHFIIITILGMACLAGLIWVLVFSVGENREKIEDAPDKADVQAVYRAFVEAQQARRRACDVVNRRFNALADLLAAQRPSANTTAYYRDHPEELAQSQAYFDQTIHVLRPQNCNKAFPISSFETIKKRAKREAAKKLKGGGSEPKGQVKPKQPP